MVRPPIRHAHALIPIGAAGVRASHRVFVLMRKRRLDGVRRKLAAFVQRVEAEARKPWALI